MIIVSLELYRYKRFQLNNIEYFKIAPEHNIQLILGSNGCGKSSLVKELNPLPPDQNDFFKDGYKTIQLVCRGNNYILKSTFSPVRHSFIKNDEELNPGGTITVFKELVKQEFNITTEVHELLIGEELFHSMSPARRREWFTKLSDTNYDYAISVYNKLKERSRDISGALKLAKKHIVTESAKIISESEEIKLRHDVEITHRELNLLIEQSAPLDNPISYYENYKNSKLEELSKLSNKLLRMRLAAPYGTDVYGNNPYGLKERDEWGESIHNSFTSIEEIEVVIDRLKHNITSKETLINNAISEHTKISETIGILVKTGEEGVKSLYDRLKLLHENKDNILSMRSLKINGIDPINSLSAFESVYEILLEISLSIPENKDKRFSQVRLNELINLLPTIKDKENNKTSSLVKLENQKAHLESHKNNGNITCPKCTHVWVPGYSDEHLASLIEMINKEDDELKAIIKEFNTVDDEIKAIKEYGEFFKDYVRCVRNWPILEPFWNYLAEGRYITDSPRKIMSILDTFRIDLSYEIDARKIDDEILEVKELITSAELVGDANLNELQNRLIEYTTKIELLTSELNKLQSDVSLYSQYRKQLLEAIELGSKIDTLANHIEETNIEMVEMIRRDTLNHCVRQLQSSLAMKETTLNTAMMQKGIVDDLQKQIDKYTIEEEAAKLLVKQLSPTDGLIAEGLLGFIKSYINQMNLLIKKIWTYPLIVQDCGLSNTELDYKFPLIVGNKTNIVSDVKLGSTGMREIVNLAFRVTAMKNLKLSDSTLFLDEFASSFDETHKVTAMNAIKTLMDNSSFSQLFMVSHDYSSYGVFTNAEICVLSDMNITVPSEYNKHVIIA